MGVAAAAAVVDAVDGRRARTCAGAGADADASASAAAAMAAALAPADDADDAERNDAVPEKPLRSGSGRSCGALDVRGPRITDASSAEPPREGETGGDGDESREGILRRR